MLVLLTKDPQPAVFTHVQDTMRIARAEIFRLVTVIRKVRSETELFKRANDSVYGVATALFARDVSRVHRIARKPEAGSSISVQSKIYISSSL